MTTRKRTEPPLEPVQAWATGNQPVQAWALDDLQAIFETLESAATILQGSADIGTMDITITYEGKKLAAHHDGTRWWVTLVG